MLAGWLEKHDSSSWLKLLTIVYSLCFLLNFLTFYPGYMSPDSVVQLEQIKGDLPIGDWHPPIMVVVGKILIALTGMVSSILFLQLLLLWGSLLLVAMFIYRETRSRRCSLGLSLIGFLPMIYGVSGVMWKDIHMAVALLASIALLIALPEAKRLNRKWIVQALLLTITALMFYAVLLRYNAIFAVIPIFLLLMDRCGVVGYSKKMIYATLGGVCILTLNFSIQQVFDVQKENPASYVMLDDISHTSGSVDTEDTKLENIVEYARRCTKDQKIITGSYLLCLNDQQRNYVSRVKHDALQELWINTVLKHIISYTLYKIEAFTFFLVAPQQFIFQEGIIPNKYGINVGSEKIQKILSLYVIDFGYRHFSYLFQPWFWLAAGVITVWYVHLNAYRYRAILMTLGYSSIFYIVGYAPIVTGADYRYIFWPVLALLLAWALIVSLKTQSVDSVKK